MKKGEKIAVGVSVVILVLLLAFVFLTQNSTSSLLFLGLMAFIGIIAFAQTKRDPNYQKQKQEKEQKKETDRYKSTVQYGDNETSERFYRECLKEGIKDAYSRSNQEKIILYAKQAGIEGSREQLINAFDQGKTIVEKNDERKRISKLREEEERILKDNRGYSTVVGREKRIKICNDCIEVCEAAISEFNQQLKYVDKGGGSLFQKKSDWAIAGGLANGLAGPAAGLATALDVQMNNMRIDANNQLAGQFLYAVRSQITSRRSRAEEEKKKWEEKLKKAQQSLYEEKSPESLMDYLRCEVLEQYRSETGVGRVRLRISQNSPLVVYDDVDAVIDGSLLVQLVKGAAVVGNGIATFPYEGSGRSFTTEVVCEGMIPESFQVSVKPNMLWAIERKC